MPSKPETTNKANTNEEKTEIENVPSVKLEKWDEIRSVVTVTTQVLPVENLRASVKNEDMQKVEEKALPGKTHKEKMQEEGTVCYL